MMEYFLLKQSEDVVNPIKIFGVDMENYTVVMTHQDFKQIKRSKVAYAEYSRSHEMPDILTYPTYMVSDTIRRVLHMYDDNISFKSIQVFPTLEKDLMEATRTYWVYDCVMEDCLHQDTIILPNGGMQEIILNKTKIKGRDIFRVKGTLDNKLIISLAVAESILRRNVYGIMLEKVRIK